MNRKSIAQEYFVLATNEKGNLSAMHKEESTAGIVAAGFMDLLLNGVFTVEKKKIIPRKENLPQELAHLASLYTYLKEKSRSTSKLMSDYASGRRIRELITEIGESLTAEQIMSEEKGDLFGNKTVYIPEKNYKDQVIAAIKSAVAKEEEMTSHDMTLLYILKETKNLQLYFSAYENEELKAKLKELKKNPQNKQLAEMIHYVSDITALAVACMLTTSN